MNWKTASRDETKEIIINVLAYYPSGTTPDVLAAKVRDLHKLLIHREIEGLLRELEREGLVRRTKMTKPDDSTWRNGRELPSSIPFWQLTAKGKATQVSRT